jgi:hypothetical protein
MTIKTERSSGPALGSSDSNARPLGEATVDVAKRFCMTRVPRQARLIGLGLAVGLMLAGGGSAGADERVSPPNCRSPAGHPNLKILENQTYALCATASCFVFNEVAYCKCDVKSGDSISQALKYDNGKDVCTVNEEGPANGYIVSTYSVPPSVLRPHGDQAAYTCPGKTSDGAYAQCDGGICFTSTRGQSFPGIGHVDKNQIICSCPITQTQKGAAVGYQITGPYPCQKSFFANCSSRVDNSQTGSTIYVGAPTGVGRLLSILLTGMNPNANVCRLP